MKFRLALMSEVMFLTIVFFLVNIRSFIFWNLYPETNYLSSEAWREVVIWIFVLLMMAFLLKKEGLIENYLSAWLNQPVLVIFVLFSLISVLWSKMVTVTLHRSLIFAFASFAAVFLGVRYSVKSLLQILSWFGAIVAVASLVLVLYSPSMGTDLSPVYNGSWRGVFWHRNHFGNILPILNLVFLVRFSSLKLNESLGQKIVFIIFYFLSLIEIFFARSASGYFVAIFLHLAFGGAFLWQKIRHFIHPWHYYILLVAAVAFATAALFNLDFIFGLFNRDVHLTGRIPMWGILFHQVIPLNPWLGQGFGTVWANLDFRLHMRDLAGWSYPIAIGDNGFIDILLNLGIVGFVLFLLNYFKAWVYSVQYFLREINTEGIFPLVFMIYTFFANLTFSLFMETEVFVWFLIVVFMVIVAQKKKEIQTLPSI